MSKFNNSANKVYLFLRKLRSGINNFNYLLTTARFYFSSVGNPAINIGKDCKFSNSVMLKVTDGGSIIIGSGSCIENNTHIVVQGGQLTIADDVFVGIGCVIVCLDNIVIGRNTQIAEYVVIRDQDHRTDTRPIRLSGFHTSPIQIGSDVWIGCKASVLRGAVVGDRSVVGAHALVNSVIPADTLAVGLPAHVVKNKK